MLTNMDGNSVVTQGHPGNVIERSAIEPCRTPIIRLGFRNRT